MGKLFLVLGVAAVVGFVILGVLAWLVLRGGRQAAKLDGPPESWVIPDSWSVATGEKEGKPMFTRFRTGLRSVAGHPAYGKQVGIAVKFVQPREDGLPDRAEQKSLNEIEAKIMRTFEGGNVHLFAGVITTGGMREFVIYTSDVQGAAGKAREVVAAFPRREIQWTVNDDPEWGVFRTFSGEKK